jgi:hypothetical protein
VNVADDATVVGALRLLAVMEEYIAECGATVAEVTQTVGAIAAVGIEFGEQPDGEPFGSVEFEDGRRINGDPGTNGIEDGAAVGGHQSPGPNGVRREPNEIDQAGETGWSHGVHRACQRLCAGATGADSVMFAFGTAGLLRETRQSRQEGDPRKGSARNSHSGGA